jgi:hypothetical protein
MSTVSDDIMSLCPPDNTAEDRPLSVCTTTWPYSALRVCYTHSVRLSGVFDVESTSLKMS